MTVLLVFAGGAVGAPGRYLLDRFVQSRHRIRFPVGTLVINVLGCFLLGLVSGWSGASDAAVALLATGFCGGFTTFSTFAVEAVELALAGRARGAAVAGGYATASVALGLAAAAAGVALT